MSELAKGSYAEFANVLEKISFPSDGVVSNMKAAALHSEAVEAAEVLLRLTTGLDIQDEHGKETPMRFVQMLQDMTTPPDIKWKTFPNDGMNEMISVSRIPFVSLCQHHVVPFIGHVSIGYVPDQIICGISKLARVAKYYAAALQVQERLTKQIADFLQEKLEPKGVAVVVEAEHMCMAIRGIQAHGVITHTASMLGVFNDHARTAKAEFLNTIRRNANG